MADPAVKNYTSGKTVKKVVVASFSSHVHRVQQVLDAAHANGRRVALLGRSMVRNMTIAESLGYLKVPQGVLVDYKKAGDIPDDRIVYMSTGSQGEPMAVLSRMANRDHQIEVGEGELVAWAYSSVHVLDIGGLTPGGWIPGSYDRYGDGFLFPVTKVVSEGVWDEQFVKFFRDDVAGNVALVKAANIPVQ